MGPNRLHKYTSKMGWSPSETSNLNELVKKGPEIPNWSWWSGFRASECFQGASHSDRGLRRRRGPGQKVLPSYLVGPVRSSYTSSGHLDEVEDLDRDFHSVQLIWGYKIIVQELLHPDGALWGSRRHWSGTLEIWASPLRLSQSPNNYLHTKLTVHCN